MPRQSKTKMRIAFHLNELANYVISAYRGLGNKIDGKGLFHSSPEIFLVVCVVLEFFREPLMSSTDMNDDLDTKESLNSFKTSRGRHRGLSVSDLFSSRSRMILSLCSKGLCVSREVYEFFNAFPKNMEKRSDIL